MARAPKRRRRGGEWLVRGLRDHHRHLSAPPPPNGHCPIPLNPPPPAHKHVNTTDGALDTRREGGPRVALGGGGGTPPPPLQGVQPRKSFWMRRGV